MSINSTEPSDGWSMVGGLVHLVAMIAGMVWFGDNVGFDGVVTVILALVLTFFLGALVSGPVLFVGALFSAAGAPDRASLSRGTSDAARSRTAAARTEPAAAMPPRAPRLSVRIRRHDLRLADELEAFEKLAAERSEFTETARRAVLATVEGYWGHREAYRHILDDPGHPDHRTVDREMGRYRRAVLDILRLRARQLSAGPYGGFDYREDLRTAESMAELLRDDLDELFRRLERD